jgi:CDGSH-type Zn-finger protein
LKTNGYYGDKKVLSLISFQIDISFCFQFLIFIGQLMVMATTKITVNSNGSLRVEGDFEIVDKNGTVYDLGGRTIVSICRCGMSKNKPFCDASHKGHFEHEAVAFNLPPKTT